MCDCIEKVAFLRVMTLTTSLPLSVVEGMLVSRKYCSHL